MDDTFTVEASPVEAIAVLTTAENWLMIIPGRQNDAIRFEGGKSGTAPDSHWVVGTPSTTEINFTDFTGNDGASSDNVYRLGYRVTVGSITAPKSTLDVRYEVASGSNGGTTVRRVVTNQRAHGALACVPCIVFSVTKTALYKENANMKTLMDGGTIAKE